MSPHLAQLFCRAVVVAGKGDDKDPAATAGTTSMGISTVTAPGKWEQEKWGWAKHLILLSLAVMCLELRRCCGV